MLSVLTALTPLIIWLINKLIFSDDLKQKAKKKYLAYIDYWQKHRESPSAISDDIDVLIKKSDETNDR